MAQQYSYGYGYGYGSPFAATPPRPVVSQVPAAPSVGYTPYVAPAATSYVAPAATSVTRAPAPSQSSSLQTATSYYQTAVASTQASAPVAAANYYGYQTAPQYGSYYPMQQAARAPTPTTPVVSYTPPTYTATPPVYTPTAVTQSRTPTTQQSLVSYPTTPANKSTAASGTYTSYQSPATQNYAQNYTQNAGRNYVNPFQAGTPNYQQNTTPNFQSTAGKTPYKPPWMAPTSHQTEKPGKPLWWNKKSTGNGQVFYCEVCKISTAGLQPQKAHLEGKHHKKKLAQQQSPTQRDRNTKFTPFRCELCDITCSSRDALDAHNRGSKHQKVLILHRKLGKPIPALKLVENDAGKKVLAGSEQKVFVGGRTLQSTAKGMEEKAGVKLYPPSANQAASQQPTVKQPQSTAEPQAATNNDSKQQEEAVKEVDPVGENLVKAVTNDPKFPHATFKCEMCDCYFNDVNAKWAHIKGRRHRLNFKKTYDKELYVEPTSSQKKDIEKRKQIAGRGGWKGGRGGKSAGEKDPEDDWDGGWDASMTPDLKHDPHDDILVLDRHKLVYPPPPERKAVNGVVEDIEKSLKGVSDDLMKEKATTASGNVNDESFRELKGVMRVGAFAHNLLLKGECTTDLVLLCEKKPTITLFNIILQRLIVRFEALVCEEEGGNVYNATPVSDQATITIITQMGDYRITVNVLFSSTLMRPEPSAQQLQADQTEGVLRRQFCVAALAALRHTKWFKATSRDTPNATGVVLRVMKDLCQRVPAWGVLESWVLELLVQKCALSCHPTYIQPGDLFRRVMECVASGLFLPGSRGLADPCEKEPVDAVAYLTATERSSITLSAQHALRLIAFRKLHLVLGVDPLPNPAERKEVKEAVAKKGEEEKEKEEIEGSAAKRPRLD